MSDHQLFRSMEEEVKNLLAQLIEIKETIGDLSAKVSRIESHVRRSFPKVASQVPAKSPRTSKKKIPLQTGEQLLNIFDEIVKVTKNTEDYHFANERLQSLDLENLKSMAKELGVSLGKQKPSKKKLIEAIIGRIKQSILLTRHNNLSN